MAVLGQPPPPRAPNPVFVTLPVGSRLTRLFDPTRHNATALQFRAWGPLHRFDHHRAPSGTPALDPDRRIYYAAYTLSCCLVEVFGDDGVVSPGDWHVAVLTLTRPLRLLDLRGPGAMRAGTISAVSKHTHRPDTQSWSRWFYEDAAFRDANGRGIDGLLYFNAHNDEETIALYERAEDALVCPASDIMRLDIPLLQSALVGSMADNHLTF